MIYETSIEKQPNKDSSVESDDDHSESASLATSKVDLPAPQPSHRSHQVATRPFEPIIQHFNTDDRRFLLDVVDRTARRYADYLKYYDEGNPGFTIQHVNGPDPHNARFSNYYGGHPYVKEDKGMRVKGTDRNLNMHFAECRYCAKEDARSNKIMIKIMDIKPNPYHRNDTDLGTVQVLTPMVGVCSKEECYEAWERELANAKRFVFESERDERDRKEAILLCQLFPDQHTISARKGTSHFRTQMEGVKEDELSRINFL